MYEEHGTCKEGQCVCNERWRSSDCSYAACPAVGTNDLPCNGHGSCDEFQGCVCEDGYRGIDCWDGFCPLGEYGELCSGQGVCDVEPGGASATTPGTGRPAGR